MKRNLLELPGTTARDVEDFGSGAAQGQLQLSQALLAALERLRTRFGVSFELLTPSLQAYFPAEGGDLFRALTQEPETARALAASLATGRNRDVETAGTTFVLQPLRASGKRRRLVGLLAVRKAEPEQDAGADWDANAERWADILRTFVDADLECLEGVRQERQRSLWATGALRFLGQLTTLQTEADVARAVVHAAAVWFDVEARIYRRDLSDEFVLHTHLPGVEPVTTRIGTMMPGRTVRVPADTEELGWASPEALIVPLSVESAGDWMLVVGGATPAEVDQVFDAIGTAMAAHLHRLAGDRCAAARKELNELLISFGRAPELAVVGALRWFMDRASASSGVVTLCEDAGVRELAAIGAFGSATSIPPVRSRTTPTGLVFPLQLGPDRTVVIELRADERRPFAQEVLPVLREAVELMRLWLAGNVDALREPLAAENLVEGMRARTLKRSPREPGGSQLAVRRRTVRNRA